MGGRGSLAPQKRPGSRYGYWLLKQKEKVDKVTEEQEQANFEQWCIVELMGHVRIAGRVSEQALFGVALGRIDIPTRAGGFTTQYFGGASVYRMTPTTEEIARQVGLHNEPEPVHRWELPAPVTAPGGVVCPHCERALPSGARSCPLCGWSAGEESLPEIPFEAARVEDDPGDEEPGDPCCDYCAHVFGEGGKPRTCPTCLHYIGG